MSEASVALKPPRVLIEFRALCCRCPHPCASSRDIGTASTDLVSGDDDDSGTAWERVRLQAFIDSEGRIRL